MIRQSTERELDEIDRRVGRAETNQLCAECGAASMRRTADGTEVFCENCGLVVVESKIDCRARRIRAAERQHLRVDAPPTRQQHDDGLMTKIDRRDVDADGVAIAARKRRRIRRLRNWQKICQTMASGGHIPESEPQ